MSKIGKKRINIEAMKKELSFLSINLEGSLIRKLCKHLEDLQPKKIIEIGTLQGVITIFLAKIADRVETFDNIENPICFKLWGHFRVKDKISYNIVKSNKEKADAIDRFESSDYQLVCINQVPTPGSPRFFDYDITSRFKNHFLTPAGLEYSNPYFF